MAVMAAADATDSPMIMQAGRGARVFANDIVLSHLIRAAYKFSRMPDGEILATHALQAIHAGIADC